MTGRRIPACAGSRALITRPHHQAERLVARLRARGIDCLVEPMLEIVSLPWNPWEVIQGKQAILLTSANAAEALIRTDGLGAIQDFSAVPLILAVGEGTARPLRRAGLTRIEAAPGSNAVDLLRLVQARLAPRGGPLAYLSGETVACDLVAALAPAGFAVDRTNVYAARPATRFTAEAREALARGSIQVAPFLSARAAATFRGLLADEGLEDACRNLVGIALSPRIADAMRPLPWRLLAVAERPDLRGLLAALDSCLAGLAKDACVDFVADGSPGMQGAEPARS